MAGYLQMRDISERKSNYVDKSVNFICCIAKEVA